MEYQKEDYNSFNNEPKQDTSIALYSSFSIVMFSIFFSSLFGAYLLRSNLIAVGNREAANRLSIFAFVYFIATIVIAMIPNPPIPILSMVMNWIGGNLLAYYFQKQLIPDLALHPKKPITKVLIASLLISLILVSLMLMVMVQK